LILIKQCNNILPIPPVPAEAPLWLWCQAKRGRQNHAQQILVSRQSSAEEGTQPSG